MELFRKVSSVWEKAVNKERSMNYALSEIKRIIDKELEDSSWRDKDWFIQQLKGIIEKLEEE